MLKKVWPLLLVVVLSAPLQGSHRDTLVKFDGGIGVLPVSNVNVNAETGAVTVNRNIVRGVNPAGQIWVIEDLKAEVRANGRIKVRGKGLLLGGGNNIGFNANASVFATLNCGTTEHSTPTANAVPLEFDGDFRIDDVLDPIPATCDSPVLLIRNANNGGWFAAGIIDADDRDDD
jgi:hypothetical protein